MTQLLLNTELTTHTARAQLAHFLISQGWMMATAESCTGGLIAATCTDLAGSSAWFERGLVTYANQAKTDLLGVDPALLARHGAVSEAVARAMVQGALAPACDSTGARTLSHAQVAVAVTGVAGPGGGSADKPVGTVWFGFALPGQVLTERCHFDGDRAQVRQATVQHALVRLAELLQAGQTSPNTPDSASN